MYKDIEIIPKYGWVKLHPPVPVYDEKGRIIGFSHRITDSDGRDEILPPILVMRYE